MGECAGNLGHASSSGNEVARILVLGLGNPILADDGVGWAVARDVHARAVRLVAREQIDLVEAAAAGLTIVSLLSGYDRVLVFDAILTGKEPPGTLYRLEPADLVTTPRLASPHDVHLAEAIALGRSLGQAMPEQVTVYAIEVADPYSFRESLTPQVAQAIPGIVEKVLAAEFGAS